MRRILAVLGLLMTSTVGATVPAQAGEVPPVVELDRAWTVAGGAGVQVAYTVTCPDPADAAAGYRHALATNHGYLEFRCGPEPQRVVMLLDTPPPAKGESLTIDATVLSPQCLYFDSSDLENGEMGCWKVSRTDTVRPRPGRFVPESTVDIGGHVDVRDVRRTRDGAVRITTQFSCSGRGMFGDYSVEVLQRTRAGLVSRSAYLGTVTCDDGSFTRSFVVPSDGEAGPFRKGRVVVSAEWVQSYEGGPWAWDSGLHRLR